MEKEQQKKINTPEHSGQPGQSSMLDESAFSNKKGTGAVARPPAFQLTANPANAPLQLAPSDSDIDNLLLEIDKKPGDFDILGFFKWQREIGELKPEYRTMGPEFEFAKLDVQNLPVHEDIAESNGRINGLPLVLETDAGNVVEMACPPFVIGTDMEDFSLATQRAMTIVNRFEVVLKAKAEEGAAQDKDLNWLLGQVEALFGIPLQRKAGMIEQYGTSKLIPFTKGTNLANEFFGPEILTNSQINLKMTTEEIGEALQEENTGKNFHATIKQAVHLNLDKQLSFLKEPLEDEELDDLDVMDEKDYRNRLSIISYYVSQIPVMSMQMMMNEVRRQHKNVFGDDAVKNRAGFMASHKANRQLLASLSKIKDYLGFWIKAGFSDMMRQDNELQSMLEFIDMEKLKVFLIGQSKGIWNSHRIGLVEYAAEANLQGFSIEEIDAEFEWTLNDIVDKMKGMAAKGNLGKPKSRDIPNHKENGTTDLMDFDDEENPAPFMARPDTHVGLEGGHLVEIRGLNKRISTNPFLRPFQMPFYRKHGELANEGNWEDYYGKAKLKKQGAFITEKVQGVFAEFSARATAEFQNDANYKGFVIAMQKEEGDIVTESLESLEKQPDSGPSILRKAITKAKQRAKTIFEENFGPWTEIQEAPALVPDKVAAPKDPVATKIDQEVRRILNRGLGMAENDEEKGKFNLEFNEVIKAIIIETRASVNMAPDKSEGIIQESIAKAKREGYGVIRKYFAHGVPAK